MAKLTVWFIGRGLPPKLNRTLTGQIGQPRRAKGQTVTADAIAIDAMRERKLDMGDGELLKDITRLFCSVAARPGTGG
jgi:hypothetical protein